MDGPTMMMHIREMLRSEIKEPMVEDFADVKTPIDNASRGVERHEGRLNNMEQEIKDQRKGRSAAPSSTAASSMGHPLRFSGVEGATARPVARGPKRARDKICATIGGWDRDTPRGAILNEARALTDANPDKAGDGVFAPLKRASSLKEIRLSMMIPRAKKEVTDNLGAQAADLELDYIRGITWWKQHRSGEMVRTTGPMSFKEHVAADISAHTGVHLSLIEFQAKEQMCFKLISWNAQGIAKQNAEYFAATLRSQHDYDAAILQEVGYWGKTTRLEVGEGDFYLVTPRVEGQKQMGTMEELSDLIMMAPPGPHPIAGADAQTVDYVLIPARDIWKVGTTLEEITDSAQSDHSAIMLELTLGTKRPYIWNEGRAPTKGWTCLDDRLQRWSHSACYADRNPAPITSMTDADGPKLPEGRELTQTLRALRARRRVTRDRTQRTIYSKDVIQIRRKIWTANRALQHYLHEAGNPRVRASRRAQPGPIHNQPTNAEEKIEDDPPRIKELLEREHGNTLRASDRALCDMQAVKSPGVDGAVAKVLQALDAGFLASPAAIFENRFRGAPEHARGQAWSKFIIQLMKKKGDKHTHKGHRPITLLTTFEKLHSVGPMKKCADKLTLRGPRSAYRKSHQAMDAIFSMRMLAEKGWARSNDNEFPGECWTHGRGHEFPGEATLHEAGLPHADNFWLFAGTAEPLRQMTTAWRRIQRARGRHAPPPGMTWGATALDPEFGDYQMRVEDGALTRTPRAESSPCLGSIFTFDGRSWKDAQHGVARAWKAFYALKMSLPGRACRWQQAAKLFERPHATWDIDVNLRRLTRAGHPARQAALPDATPAQLVPVHLLQWRSMAWLHRMKREHGSQTHGPKFKAWTVSNAAKTLAVTTDVRMSASTGGKNPVEMADALLANTSKTEDTQASAVKALQALVAVAAADPPLSCDLLRDSNTTCVFNASHSAPGDITLDWSGSIVLAAHAVLQAPYGGVSLRASGTLRAEAGARVSARDHVELAGRSVTVVGGSSDGDTVRAYEGQVTIGGRSARAGVVTLQGGARVQGMDVALLGGRVEVAGGASVTAGDDRHPEDGNHSVTIAGTGDTDDCPNGILVSGPGTAVRGGSVRLSCNGSAVRVADGASVEAFAHEGELLVLGDSVALTGCNTSVNASRIQVVANAAAGANISAGLEGVSHLERPEDRYNGILFLICGPQGKVQRAVRTRLGHSAR
ncbi:unnamed protein product [Prorocentrum cordatum]|uniref:Uncharacterized protein n=1 Tax=Prorocentrum cordatum TaxID=2364126 RepID=A0ABN9X7J5_9DINO|nr:unnamed protein product [Polarella glacialis]